MSYKATAWAYDMSLASPMKPVLVALADMADEAGTCFPGQKRLADMTGLSTKTVGRALVKLERLGLVSRWHRQDSFGHRTSDRFKLHLTVSVPESLPDTVPSRQRAYKAESPSLTDSQSIPNGHSVRGTIRRTTREPSGGASTPPPVDNSPFCPKHPNGTTRACAACGDARRAHDAALRAERSKPTPTPQRGDEVPPHEHRWAADGTCIFPECIARREVA